MKPQHTSAVLAGLTALTALIRPVASQEPTPPPDRSFHTDSAASACLDRAIQSRVANATRTFPQVRQRFAKGLPPGHHLSVTTRVQDRMGHFEQVFVAVDSLSRDTVFGRIASDIGFVEGFRSGQAHAVTLRDVLDWTIVRPDGTEEGNFVGKYLDSLQDRLRGGGIPKPC
jgi:hypothetical protein